MNARCVRDSKGRRERLYRCGITSEGTAYCWGVNDDGELGIGTATGPGQSAALVGLDILISTRMCSGTEEL